MDYWLIVMHEKNSLYLLDKKIYGTSESSAPKRLVKPSDELIIHDVGLMSHLDTI